MIQERDALDRALARKGETITLRRQTGGSLQNFAETTCKAFVRGYTSSDLVGGISQNESLVIMSPTAIFDLQWPASPAAGATADARIPVKGDRVVIQGRVRVIEAVGQFFIGDELARLELRVKG